MGTQLSQILTLCDDLLQPGQFDDYCPNGLQVEGAESVDRIVTGVTANQALIEAAIDSDAQAILVHHGYFWKGDSPRVTGMLRNRLRLLLSHNISLLAYHLPLDAQPEFGNNVQLANLLDIEVESGLEANRERSIGLVGRLSRPMQGKDFAEHLRAKLNREPLHVEGRSQTIETIAWCTGAAQGFIEKAVGLKVDAYLTGEVSESTVHVARETGIHFFAAGHHATERYGIQALGARLAGELGVEHQFVDIDNPV